MSWTSDRESTYAALRERRTKEELWTPFVRQDKYQDPPHLVRPVRIKILKPFVIHNQPLPKVGDEVIVEWHVARDAVFLNRAAWVDECDKP